ncbi:MAG: glycosyltransferase family 4 protein [Deltaproteobacteria bacterium]
MPSIAYASFDRFWAPKGASVHIDAFTRALAAAYGRVDLLTIAPFDPDAGPYAHPQPTQPRERAGGVVHWPFDIRGKNLIARVEHFRAQLWRWWRENGPFDVAHFRSIFEGYPIAKERRTLARRVVYEVNGLPSIELKYHYPDVADDHELLGKLRAQEQTCIAAADLLVTPSAVTAEHLVARGAHESRIEVVPNGVDLDCFTFRERRGPPKRWLYTGTMTAWQGVFAAIEALRLHRRDDDARLTLVGPVRKSVRRKIEATCAAHGLTDHVDLLDPVDQSELAALHHEHDLALVPLLPNDRNLEQGCCPLKLIEAMACGTPVIASDLPVVTQLAEPETEALIVRPGSPKAIKDGVLRLQDDAELGPRLTANARRRVEQHYTWPKAGAQLVAAYERTLANAPTL